MGRLLKILLYLVGAVVALVILAAVFLTLFFDPNDFRDRIAEETRNATGRELNIEGDLEVSFFPWLAIGMGKTTLGNAEGFGDEPFATFESARLSVRVLPLLLSQEVSVGTAELESLQLNLAVARDGRTNWDDLAEGGDAPVAETGADTGEAAGLDIAGISVTNAALNYSDAQTGDTYRLTDINLESGRVAAGAAIPLSGRLSFEMQPADMAGDVEIDTSVTFDPDAKLVTLGDVDMSLVGVDISATVEPISYAAEPEIVATIAVDAFSLKSLMQRLNIEPPETVDPNALGKLILDARARVDANRIALTDVELVVDDTTLTGEMTMNLDESGRIDFAFEADSINLDGYMAPVPEETVVTEDTVPVEIPVDLIRTLNLSGTVKLAEANLTGMKFEQLSARLRAANGDMRLHPMSATLFDGTYSGDVRINASGNVPSLSVNETIAGVDLGALARAMFDTEQVTGKINGTFQLAGQGEDLAAIQTSLDGQLNFELVDGAYEGVDVWYELRRARALFKQEAPPEPVLPARTQFSNVTATGPVTDGIFRNDDLLAELPFMRLTGKGKVDLPAATIDYGLTARVLEKPEFATDATEEELKEFTEAVIPLRISGPLAAPSIKPDVEGMLKERVREELEDKVLDKLLGGKKKDKDGKDKDKDKEKDTEDEIKDALKDIFKN